MSSSSSEQKETSRKKQFHNKIIMNKLHLNNECADVHFVFTVDDQETLVPAHKILLSACSPVFYAMFFGDLKEAGNVEIVDVSVDGFKDFLSIFYLDEVTVTIGNVAEIAYLSDKYDVTKGLEMCEEFLLEHTKVDELCTHFELATKFNLHKFRKYCEREIRKNATDVFTSDAFIKTNSKMLNAILQLNRFNCLTYDVFEACIRWAKNVCDRNETDTSDGQNLRAAFGDCFYSIPFTVMKMTEFLEVATTNRTLFTADEVLDIMNFITNGTATEITDKFTKKNNSDVFFWDDNALLTCIRDGKKGPFDIFPIEYITFSSTHELLFGGLKLFDLKVSPWAIENAKINISILRRGESLAPDQIFEKIKLFNDVDYSDSQFKLEKPIIIKPHVKYTIQIEFHACRVALMALSYERSYTLEPNISIEFHADVDSQYNNARQNMISELYFNRL